MTSNSSLTQAVAILTGPATHLDHLGILSAIIGIPLIVTDPYTFQLAKKYYPQIDVHLMDLSDLSLDYLCQHFDVIFESVKFWSAELKPTMELFYQKKMRFVYCPHGNSDKGHSLKDHPSQDFCLVYGDHLIEHLKNTGAFQHIQGIIPTGNYRYAFYQQWRSFYDSIIEEEIFSQLSHHKPTLLYAPTWQDSENQSSFFSLTDHLIHQLGSQYNLLIKPHPFLIEDHPEKILALADRCSTHPSIRIIENLPLIYPLLNRCDLYLGDYSSIGYDFLAFNRSLYFYQPSGQSRLSTCGLSIAPSQLDSIATLITLNDHRYEEKRKSLYQYAFGLERTPEVLRDQINTALGQEAMDY